MLLESEFYEFIDFTNFIIKASVDFDLGFEKFVIKINGKIFIPDFFFIVRVNSKNKVDFNDFYFVFSFKLKKKVIFIFRVIVDGFKIFFSDFFRIFILNNILVREIF